MTEILTEFNKGGSVQNFAITVKDLVHRYPSGAGEALVVDDLTIREGEIVLVTGKSGSGKSTLVNCINGVIPHLFPGDSEIDQATHQGEVFVHGHPVSKTPLHVLSTIVGTLLQDPETQILNYDVEEEIAFGPENLCLLPDEINRRVNEAVRVTGIGHLLGKETYKLSGGELQRVMAAAVLAMTPRVFIFDEPTSNIDPAGTVALLDLMRTLRGKTVVIVEHKVERVLPFVDRVILMDNGRIVSDVPSASVIERADEFASYGVEVPEHYMYAKKIGLASADVGQVVSEMKKRKMIVAAVSRRTPAETVLRAQLKVFDGNSSLLDVRIALGKGEILAVMGRNGAGKSTMLKAIMGVLDRKLRGEVRLNAFGIELGNAGVAERGRYITYVPQNFDLTLVSRTVKEEVAYSPKKRGLKDWRTKVDNLLEMLSLTDQAEQDPLALSFGQRRRVALGSALASDVRVALLDEPTSGQDFSHREALGEELTHLAKMGYSFIVVTHDARFVYRHCDRVAVLSEGRLALDGTPEIVFENSEKYGVPPPTEYSLYRELSRS